MHCRYPRVNFCTRALEPHSEKVINLLHARRRYAIAQPSRRIINCRPDRNCCTKQVPASSSLFALYNHAYRDRPRCRWVYLKSVVAFARNACNNSLIKFTLLYVLNFFFPESPFVHIESHISLCHVIIVCPKTVLQL